MRFDSHLFDLLKRGSQILRYKWSHARLTSFKPTENTCLGLAIAPRMWYVGFQWERGTWIVRLGPLYLWSISRKHPAFYGF